MVDLPPAVKDLILLLSVPGLYCLMLLLGRWLKRSHGVRLNWSYHLFSLCLAIYFPAKLFGQRLKLELWGKEHSLPPGTGRGDVFAGGGFRHRFGGSLYLGFIFPPKASR